MAGKLVQVATNTVTSAVSSVTLTGISDDSVYMLAINNVLPTTDTSNLKMRLTVSGTPDTTANYDRAGKILRTSTTFINSSATNETAIPFGQLGTAGSESFSAIFYLYNFNNASEYSFATNETVLRQNTAELLGAMGGFVNTVSQSCDGVHFYINEASRTLASGTFTLYRVV